MTNASANYAERSNRMLAFMIGDTRFAIDISSILSITDDFDKLERSSNHQNGFLGYLYYRNKPVNTFEISSLLGHQSNRQLLTKTIGALQEAEQDHVKWEKSLEAALRSNTSFDLVWLDLVVFESLFLDGTSSTLAEAFLFLFNSLFSFSTSGPFTDLDLDPDSFNFFWDTVSSSTRFRISS